MSERDARRAAEATPDLAGATIRAFGSVGGFYLALIFGVISVLGAVMTTRLALAYLFGFVMLVGFALWYVRAVGAVRINNEGVAALLRGDDAVAGERFRALVGRFATRENVAMGLHNLGVVALRGGRPESAAPILRAALAVSGAAFRLRRAPDALAALVRSHLAFALTAKGELDAAARVLAELGAGEGASHLPMVIAYAARARAFLALRQGKPEDAIAALDAERALLSTVLTGNESMLAEAMLAVAKGEGTVWVDAEGARFVFSYLPEAKPYLAQEEDD